MFRKTDVVRAVAAAKAAGLDIARVEIDKDGRIVVVTTNGTTPDDAIDREIEELKARQHGNRHR